MFNRSIVIKKAREILVVAYILKRLIYLNVENNDVYIRFFFRFCVNFPLAGI